jgi:ubiquinone/menaquinone biosynthesis C-methylase UbiE
MTDVRAQFGCPTGRLGAVVGWLMAIKNGGRSDRVLAYLAAGAGDRVLEVGFGPGVDVARVAARAAFVGGIDMSAVMIGQASRRNRAAIHDGRVVLKQATMPEIPFEPASFDKAFSINSYQFWREKAPALASIRRVVRPGGRVVVAVQPRNKGATDATARAVGEEIAGAMREAGYSNVRTVIEPTSPVATACVIAES